MFVCCCSQASATPYDPSPGKGVVGKNYAYQMCAETAVYFSEDVEINPFIGAGAAGQRVIDEFNSDHFDHPRPGFHRRIADLCRRDRRTPHRSDDGSARTPAMGRPDGRPRFASTTVIRRRLERKGRSCPIGIAICRSIRPTQILMACRSCGMTFDWHDNEYKMAAYSAAKMEEIVRAMKPERQATISS